jgi:hypothetical protein
MDMSRYRVVHTGAKTQFGGFHDGFAIVGYHVATLAVVVSAPMAEAAKATMMNRVRASQRFTAQAKRRR